MLVRVKIVPVTNPNANVTTKKKPVKDASKVIAEARKLHSLCTDLGALRAAYNSEISDVRGKYEPAISNILNQINDLINLS